MKSEKASCTPVRTVWNTLHLIYPQGVRKVWVTSKRFRVHDLAALTQYSCRVSEMLRGFSNDLGKTATPTERGPCAPQDAELGLQDVLELLADVVHVLQRDLHGRRASGCPAVRSRDASVLCEKSRTLRDLVIYCSKLELILCFQTRRCERFWHGPGTSLMES